MSQQLPSKEDGHLIRKQIVHAALSGPHCFPNVGAPAVDITYQRVVKLLRLIDAFYFDGQLLSKLNQKIESRNIGIEITGARLNDSAGCVTVQVDRKALKVLSATIRINPERVEHRSNSLPMQFDVVPRNGIDKLVLLLQAQLARLVLIVNYTEQWLIAKVKGGLDDQLYNDLNYRLFRHKPPTPETQQYIVQQVALEEKKQKQEEELEAREVHAQQERAYGFSEPSEHRFVRVPD